MVPAGLECEIGPAGEKFSFEIAWIGKTGVRSGRPESGNHKAVNFGRRVGHRHLDTSHAQPAIAQNLPNGAVRDHISVVEGQLVCADIVALEIENAVLSRPLAGHEGGPRRRRNRRNRGHEHAGSASVH